MADQSEREQETASGARRVPPMPQRDAYYPPDAPVKKRPSLVTMLLLLMTAAMGLVTVGVLTLGTMAGPVLIIGFVFVAVLVVQYFVWGRLFEKMYRSDQTSSASEPPPPMRERL